MITVTTETVINKLKDNTNLIIEILEEFKFYNITESGKEIRAGYDESSNPTSVRINIETLYCNVYSKNLYGNIYKLLMFQSEESFKLIHQYLIAKLGGEVELTDLNKPKKSLFGGVFDDDYEVVETKRYDECILNKYESIPSLRFYEDNIFLSTQKRFEVMYDNSSNRIIIPWRDSVGALIGTTGRYNYEIKEDSTIAKYLAIDKFKKKHFLFGLNITVDYIINSDLAIIVESEKAVMKLYQMGFKNAVAVGSHSISDIQALLLSSYCSKVIVAFDEELTEGEIIHACSNLKEHFTEIYYIYDEDKIYLPKGSKMSPADLNINDFKSIMRECRKRLI